MTIQVVDKRTVQEYLMGCEPDILRDYLLVLGESTRYKDSGPYVCKACQDINPNSPIITLLSQSEKQEETWINLMKIAEDVGSQRGLPLKPFFPRFYSDE